MNQEQKNYCTLEYADAFLPELKKIVKQIVTINKTLEFMSSVEISYEDVHTEMSNNLKFNKRFFKLSYDLYRYLDLLLEKGIIVKDIDRGIIDIYSWHKGREIFLCWSLGENSIMYWRESNSGHKDRKPISLLRHNN